MRYGAFSFDGNRKAMGAEEERQDETRWDAMFISRLRHEIRWKDKTGRNKGNARRRNERGRGAKRHGRLRTELDEEGRVRIMATHTEGLLSGTGRLRLRRHISVCSRGEERFSTMSVFSIGGRFLRGVSRVP
jgi:hypothetical protein